MRFGGEKSGVAVFAGRHARLAVEHATEVTASREAYLERDLRNALMRVLEKLLGLLNAIPVKIGDGREAEFFVEAGREVVVAQAHMRSDFLA
jgi:hypothetical protein